jgi:hypothetical protein
MSALPESGHRSAIYTPNTGQLPCVFFSLRSQPRSHESSIGRRGHRNIAGRRTEADRRIQETSAVSPLYPHKQTSIDAASMSA